MKKLIAMLTASLVAIFLFAGCPGGGGGGGGTGGNQNIESVNPGEGEPPRTGNQSIDGKSGGSDSGSSDSGSSDSGNGGGTSTGSMGGS